MAEYFNQFNARVTEVAILRFSHTNVVEDNDVEHIQELVCHVGFLPEIAMAINQAYAEHLAATEKQKQSNATNKSLS